MCTHLFLLLGFEYNQGGAGYGGYEGGEGGFGGMDPMNQVEMGGFDAIGAGETKGSDQKKTYKDKTILSVNVKQIKSAEKGPEGIKIDSCDIENVRLMGNIISVNEQSTNVEYQVNDGTGTIKVRRWIEKDQPKVEEMYAQCVEGSFVSLVGTIKEYQDELSVQSFRMTVVEDYDQMTHHLLDVILSHNLNLKGPIPGSANALAAKSNVTTHNAYSASSPGMRVSNDSGSDIEAELMRAIRETGLNSEEGTTVDLVFQFLARNGAKVTKESVQKYISVYHENGVIYGTIDEEHFKSYD